MSKISQASQVRHHKKEEKKWYVLSQEEIFHRLNSKKSGLTNEQVKKKLASFGLNRLPEAKKEPKWLLFFKQFKSS